MLAIGTPAPLTMTKLILSPCNCNCDPCSVSELGLSVPVPVRALERVLARAFWEDWLEFRALEPEPVPLPLLALVLVPSFGNKCGGRTSLRTEGGSVRLLLSKKAKRFQYFIT